MTWPLHDLVLRTADLELRALNEQTAGRLAHVLPDDVELDPALSDLRLPRPQQRRMHVLQAYWRQAGSWSPDDWVLPFAVSAGPELIGLQTLEGKHFAVRREVDTASWLVPSARGRGWGRQMRAAVLGLAFAHLGAVRAVTEAWADNAASLGVSRALGYLPNGTKVHDHGGQRRIMVKMVLENPDLPTVEVSGLPPCLPLLGLS